MLNVCQQTRYAALCKAVQTSLRKTEENPPVWLEGFSPVTVCHLEEIVICAFRQSAASSDRIFVWTIDLADYTRDWDQWDTEVAAIDFFETLVTETLFEDLGGTEWWTAMKHIDVGKRLTFVEVRDSVSLGNEDELPDRSGHWSVGSAPEAPVS